MLNSWRSRSTNCILILGMHYFCQAYSRMNYTGYQVAQISVLDTLNWDSLVKFTLAIVKTYKDNVEIWMLDRKAEKIDLLMAPKHSKEIISQFLDIHIASVTYVINDLQSEIEQSELENMKATTEKKNRYIQSDGIERDKLGIPNNVINRYATLEEIYGWMDLVAEENPKLVSVTTIGGSSENRDLKMMTIGMNKYIEEKPSILVTGTMHAREWISTATALIVAYQHIITLLEDPSYTTIWHIIPVINPDGYHYSHTMDRIWKKNRRKPQSADPLSPKCHGVDLDKNFDYQWGKGDPALQKACSNDYGGSKAFSEEESKALEAWLKKNEEFIKFSLDIHAYGGYITTRWKVERNKEMSSEVKELIVLTREFRQLVDPKHETEYEIINAEKTALIGGSLNDWLRSRPGIAFSFKVNLDNADDNKYFVPVKDIPNMGINLYKAIDFAAREIGEKYKDTGDILLWIIILVLMGSIVAVAIACYMNLKFLNKLPKYSPSSTCGRKTFKHSALTVSMIQLLLTKGRSEDKIKPNKSKEKQKT